MPPIDLDRLVRQYALKYNDQFVIQFRQGGTGDFSTAGDEDGMYLDEVVVYQSVPTYVTLPLIANFESGRLEDYWRWGMPVSTTSTNGFIEVTDWDQAQNSGTYALRMGGRTDGTNFKNAADLHLDLSNYSQVQLEFAFKDFAGENSETDAIFFSDDGGTTFSKVFQLFPESYPNNQFQTFQIDVDSLAFDKSLRLSNQFIIRWQQNADSDFNSSGDEDGFFVDDVLVTGDQSIDSPTITSFAPKIGESGTTVGIRGSNFTNNSVVRFGNVPAREVTFVNDETLQVTVPPLATTGKISVVTDIGKTVSADFFTVLGNEVIFFEGWETSTILSMWRPESTTDAWIYTSRTEHQWHGCFF